MNLRNVVIFLLLTLSFHSYGDKKLNIVTSSSPVASLFYMITQNDATITYLAKNYGCAHDYHIQPSQIAAVNKSDVIAYIDPEFDGFILKAGAQNNKGYMMKFSDLKLSLLKDSAGFTNWHVWLSPSNVRVILLEIFNVMAKLYPAKAEAFSTNYNNSLQLLDLLDKRMKSLDARKILLLNDSLEYLFVDFKDPVSQMFLGGKQPTLQYIQELRSKYNSEATNCLVIDQEQSLDYYSNIIGNSSNILQLNGESWPTLDKDKEPHLFYYNQIQSMINTLSATCFDASASIR